MSRDQFQIEISRVLYFQSMVPMWFWFSVKIAFQRYATRPPLEKNIFSITMISYHVIKWCHTEMETTRISKVTEINSLLKHGTTRNHPKKNLKPPETTQSTNFSILSSNMVLKLISDGHNLWKNGRNELKFGMYIKFGILNPNMVLKLIIDGHLINYSWDLSNLRKNGRNKLKFGMCTKFCILSPSMVLKLISHRHLINYSWYLSNLWRNGRSPQKINKLGTREYSLFQSLLNNSTFSLCWTWFHLI